MVRNRVALLLVFFLVFVLVLPGCRDGEPVTPEPDPEPGLEQDPEPGNLPEALELEGTDIRTVQLEPTANNIQVSYQYISYYLPANIDLLLLKDIYGKDYTLSKPKGVELPTMEGACWRGRKLYYLSRPGGPVKETGKTYFYEYDTGTHAAVEHKLNFPESFSPETFYVTRDGEVYFVGETGAYKYSLGKKTMAMIAEAVFEESIFSGPISWHPREPLLFYCQGNQLMCFDSLEGKSRVVCQASGEIKELFWGDSDLPALLAGNVEILAADGTLQSRIALPSGAYSLSWVPQGGKISFLTRPDGDELPRLTIQDVKTGKRCLYRSCHSYLWTWDGNIWVYADQEGLVLSRIHWGAGLDTVPIPYYVSREEDPKLPLAFAQGDFEKIAAELFRLRMEEYKRQGNIAQYKINGVSFDSEDYWGFQAMVEYSVQAIDGDWQSGNGELGEDGWIFNKLNFIRIYRDEDHYVLGNNWTTSP
jgi:hypothetical protein